MPGRLTAMNNDTIAQALSQWVPTVCPDYTMVTLLVHRESYPQNPLVIPVLMRPDLEVHCCLRQTESAGSPGPSPS